MTTEQSPDRPGWPGHAGESAQLGTPGHVDNTAIAAERVDYRAGELVEESAPADPLALFDRWLDDAFAARDAGLLAEPTAMVVASIGADGAPSARTVLLKAREDGGFCFYTNYHSRKGRELAGHPAVALLFGWHAIQRQVRVEGAAERVDRAESEAYFATRPRGSQLGAWASPQSEETTVEQLAARYAEVEERFADGAVPCPPFWGGFRVVPRVVEFWQGRPSRMHDRLRYTRTTAGWNRVRLAP